MRRSKIDYDRRRKLFRQDAKPITLDQVYYKWQSKECGTYEWTPKAEDAFGHLSWLAEHGKKKFRAFRERYDKKMAVMEGR